MVVDWWCSVICRDMIFFSDYLVQETIPLAGVCKYFGHVMLCDSAYESNS
jgi:hypothetical protein